MLVISRNFLGASHPVAFPALSSPLRNTLRNKRHSVRLASWSSKLTPSHDTLIYPDAPSKEHSDLDSFLQYAKRTGLNSDTAVYRGTHYEYTASKSLSQYGFSLKRVGGRADLGTDLLGTWTLPDTKQTLRVLVQCKAGLKNSGPQNVRELQGALGEAPPGWRAQNVMGMLIAEKAATKGTRDALKNVDRPMGYIFCTKEGQICQIMWNLAAENQGLSGISVSMKQNFVEGDVRQQLVLMRGGHQQLPILQP